MAEYFEKTKLIETLPEYVVDIRKNKHAQHSREVAKVKSEIIFSNYHPVEYHILKVDKGNEYKFLKHEIEIKELWKIVLIRLLEIIA